MLYNCSLRRTLLTLALVLALVPVFLHYVSYRHTGHQIVPNQNERQSSPTSSTDEVGKAVVCTYGASLWGGHFVWSKRHHWTSYTKKSCPRLTPKSKQQNAQLGAVNLSDGDSAAERLLRNVTTVVLLNKCMGEDQTIRGVVSVFGAYSYVDRVVSCGRELALQYPRAVIAWKIDYSLIPTGKEVEELVDYLIYKHVMEAYGIIVVNADREVEQRLRHLATHLMLLSTVEATKRLVSFQRVGLEGYRHNTLHRRCQLLLYTRKYDAFCHPARALAHPLLITGLGGSGTHHVAQRLAAEGWRVRHEEIDRDGSVSWFYAANDRAVGLPYPYGDLPDHHRTGVLHPRFGHVMHLVRHPEAQIASFTAHSNKTYNFVLRVMQHVLPHLLPEETPSVLRAFQQARVTQDSCVRGESCHLHFAALTWLHWNRFVHRYADATFRVDQAEEIVAHVCTVMSAMESESTTAIATKRYCDVPSCPAVSGWTAGWKHTATRVADSLFGVCQMNEALFRRSAVHKRHLQFTLDDVRKLDPQLANDISNDAALYGLQAS